MSQRSVKPGAKKQYLLIVITLMLTVACGDSTESSRDIQPIPPPPVTTQAPVPQVPAAQQLPQFPTLTNGQAPVSLNQMNQSVNGQSNPQQSQFFWTQMQGNYDGTVTKLGSSSNQNLTQPYTMILSETSVTQNNQTLKYAQIRIQSSGSIGNIDVSSLLGIDINGQASVYTDYYTGQSYIRTTYSFVSTVQNIPALTSKKIVVQLYISLLSTTQGAQSATQFDPSTSGLYIKDCELTNGVSCSNQLREAWFNKDMKKR